MMTSVTIESTRAATTTREQGKLLRWLHGSDGTRWGTDPGAYDPAVVARTIAAMDRMFGRRRYFRLDVSGLDNVPATPAMLVSNHSGGTTIPDVWGFCYAWYRHFGFERPLHPLAHEMIMATQMTGKFFSKRGVLRAEARVAYQALTDWGRHIMVMPGGDRDTWRPYHKRYQVCFAGRSGYARLALRAGVPIVPVANTGAHETLYVISDGQRIAEKLRLKEIARAGIFPIHLSVPWGLAIGPLPHLPLPTTLRYRAGEPIAVPTDWSPAGRAAGEEPPTALVAEIAAAAQAAVQGLLTQLATENQS